MIWNGSAGKLRRIGIVIVATLAVVAAVVYLVLPMAMSVYMARTAPPNARIAPVELSDSSLSVPTGQKVSYFGYEFELPWNDLDPSQTKLYPEMNPNRVALTFRSGLRLVFTAVSAKEYISEMASMTRVSPEQLEAAFGRGTSRSDYALLKQVYELTPQTMHHWSFSPAVHQRECLLLTIKSITLPPAAESGIFKIQNSEYKGFQQGNPRVHPNSLSVSLYSDDGSVDFILGQMHYKNAAGVSQPEMNRLVQSLHKVSAPQDVASAHGIQ